MKAKKEVDGVYTHCIEVNASELRINEVKNKYPFPVKYVTIIQTGMAVKFRWQREGRTFTSYFLVREAFNCHINAARE
jgi:hypothetical protein